MKAIWVVGVAAAATVGLSGCGVPTGEVSPGVSVTSAGPPSAPSVETVAPVTAKPRIAKVLVDAPGMVFQRTEEALLAPSTFTVDGDRVVVADSVNWAFAVYSGSKRVLSIPRPPGSSTIDLVIRGDRWYALGRDNEVEVYLLSANGKRLVHQKTLEFVPSQGTSSDSDRVRNFVADGDNLFVVSWDGACMPIEGDCPTAEVSFENRGDRSFVLRDGPVHALIELNQLIGTHSRLGMEGGDTYYDVTSMDEGRFNKHRYLYRFGADGRLTGTYTLPTAEDDLPKRDLVISGGKVYLMLNTTKSAKIVMIDPNP